MEWPEVDTSGVSGIFDGIQNQINYLKGRLDKRDALMEGIGENSDDTGNGNNNGSSVEMMMFVKDEVDTCVKKEDFKEEMNTFQSEMKQIIEELRNDLSQKDEREKDLIQTINTLKNENKILKSKQEVFEGVQIESDVKFMNKIEELTNNHNNHSEETFKKFSEVMDTIKASEDRLTERIDAIDVKLNDIDSNLLLKDTKLDALKEKLSKLSGHVAMYDHLFETHEKLIKNNTHNIENFVVEYNRTNSEVKALFNDLEVMQTQKADVTALRMKVDASEMKDKVDVSVFDHLRDEFEANQREYVIYKSKNTEVMNEERTKVSKRLDFIMDCVRDLQQEAAENDEEDARLKCLACNRPIGNMGEDTPYNKDPMMVTMESKKKLMDDNNDPQSDNDGINYNHNPKNARRNVARAPGTPLGAVFIPSGTSERSKGIPNNKLARMYAQPNQKDRLSETPLMEFTAYIPSGEGRATTYTGDDSLDGYMTIGRQLNFAQMQSAIHGYPSLTGGLIPEQTDYQYNNSARTKTRTRPMTAPNHRRSRQNHEE